MGGIHWISLDIFAYLWIPLVAFVNLTRLFQITQSGQAVRTAITRYSGCPLPWCFSKGINTEKTAMSRWCPSLSTLSFTRVGFDMFWPIDQFPFSCEPWCWYIYLHKWAIFFRQMLVRIFQHHGLHMRIKQQSIVHADFARQLLGGLGGATLSIWGFLRHGGYPAVIILFRSGFSMKPTVFG